MFRTLAVTSTLFATTSAANAQYPGGYGGYPGYYGGHHSYNSFSLGINIGGYPYGGFGGYPYDDFGYGGFGSPFGFGGYPYGGLGYGGYPYGGLGYGGFGDSFGFAVPLYSSRSAYAPPAPTYARPAPTYLAPPAYVQPVPTTGLVQSLPQPAPVGDMGLRITEVLAGPAAEAGLKVGDTITKVAGLRVRSLAETRAALAPIPSGNVVVEYLDALTGQPASKVVGVRDATIGVNVAEVPLN